MLSLHTKYFKFTRATAVFIILASAVIISAAIIICSGGRSAPASTTEQRVEYLRALGWEADAASEQGKQIVLPRQLDGVMENYNALQKSQGFDLERYAGLACEVYTYEVTNYPGGGAVLAQLIVYKGRVIGGDIHSTALDGFMHTLK